MDLKGVQTKFWIDVAVVDGKRGMLPGLNMHIYGLKLTDTYYQLAAKTMSAMLPGISAHGSSPSLERMFGNGGGRREYSRDMFVPPKVS